MRVIVLVPMYNDWASARQLLSELDRLAADRPEGFSVIVVNDGSNEPRDLDAAFVDGLPHLEHLEIVDLVANFGHAHAIAIGLGYVASRHSADTVVVMDADGEDRPEDVGRLLEAVARDPSKVAVAHRAQRSEGLAFRGFYLLYKGLFWLLTGRPISFGNFCALPWPAVRKLVHVPDLWNHLAACLVHARLPVERVPTARGHRYFGSSKMNLVSLVQHGLGAIAVYGETVLVRILLALLAFFLLIAAAMVTVVGIRFATDLAIPGWASTVFGVLAILLVQSSVFLILLVFVSLKNRGAAISVPALHYQDCVADVAVLRE